MVSKDAGQIRGAEVPETRADSLESRICGSKDGDIAKVVHGVHKVGAGEGASQRGQSGSDSSVGRALGQSEDFPNDMYHAYEQMG